MSQSEAGAVRREIFIAADQAVVFAFLTDPDKITRWMGVHCDLNPRPGGVYLVHVSHEDIAKGEFEEVTPNSRLVYSFGWQNGAFGVTPGSSRIEIDLTPRNGGTLLNMVHSGLPGVAVDPHTEGWTHYLHRLSIAASGGDPGPDSMLGRNGT